jgi:DNA-binding GntR family transcriptional regulator
LIKVRAPNGGEAVSARLRRGVLDPERRLKVEEHREKLTRFMDRWHDELSEAERRDLQAFVSELEQVLNEDSSNQRQPPEPLFARSDAVLQQIGEIRGTDAAVSNFLFATAKYLKEEDRTKIAQWIADIKQARERADWTAALAISQQVDRDLAQFSDNLHLIARTRIFAMQERLAPALSHKVMSALGHIDDGVDKSDGDKIKQGIEELWNLWPDIRTEIAKSGETPPQITKPVE